MQGMQRIKINRPRLAEMVYEQIVSGLQSGEIVVVLVPSSYSIPFVCLSVIVY